MSEWDDYTTAQNEAEKEEFHGADPLPPGLHWTRIVRANGYKNQQDGTPTVVLNFAELEPPPPTDENPDPDVREHAHFEKFVKNSRRMVWLVKTLKALGAPDEVRADSYQSYEWLQNTPESCRNYEYQIEVKANSSGGKVYLNATILQERPASTERPQRDFENDPDPSSGKSWSDWGNKKKDDDVSF